MNIIDKLEQKFGKYTISNLTYYLIGGQILAFLLIYINPNYVNVISLQGNLVFTGQWWRLITFIFMPLSRDIIFAAFTFYIYYLYGTILEKEWGSFRYLVYFLISWFGTIMLSFIFPNAFLGNGYIYLSLFLAFAYLYPDFRLYIFFIIPVKVKWLAILAWIGIIGSLIFGSFAARIEVLVSIMNFLLFFGMDIMKSLKLGLHHGAYQSQKALHLEKAHHICAVCGKNEIDNPDMQIRYCNKCIPQTCYCGDHIDNHPHKSKLLN